MGLPPTLTLYHNPKCGTSRTVLEMIKTSGQPFEVVEYLKTGWTRERLQALLTLMNAHPRALLRMREPKVKEMGLDQPDTTAATILKAMVADPILVERPILSGPKGTALCRPADLARTMI